MEDFGKQSLNYTIPDTDENRALEPHDILLITGLVLALVVGLLGNLILMLVLHMKPHPKTLINDCILKRSITDIIVLLTAPMLIHKSAFGWYLFGEMYCLVYGIFTQMGKVTSFLLLGLMMLQYYLACRSHKYNLQSRWKFQTVGSVLAWGCGGMFSIFIQYYTWIPDQLFQQKGKGGCDHGFMDGDKMWLVFLITVLVGSIKLLFWSFRMLLRLMRNPAFMLLAITPDWEPQDMPSFKPFLIILSVFTITTQLPLFIIVYLTHALGSVNVYVAVIFGIVHYFSFALNSVLCLCLKSDLRRELIYFLPSRFVSTELLIDPNTEEGTVQ